MSSHDILRGKTDDGPRDIVQRASRRDQACAVHNDGDAVGGRLCTGERCDKYDDLLDVAEPAVRVTFREEPRYDGGQPEEEEPSQEAVHLTCGEQAVGADDAPDHGCSIENFSACADEVIFLQGIAHVWNVGEHPGLHGELDDACDHCRDDLTPEHRSRP